MRVAKRIPQPGLGLDASQRGGTRRLTAGALAPA